MADKSPFSVGTLKDEYHVALRRGMAKLLIRRGAQARVFAMIDTAPDTYICLAALAHEHGQAALYLGIRIALAGVDLENEIDL